MNQNNQPLRRTQNVIRNTFWAIFSNAAISLAGIYSRALFIRVLGDELLGVNSLFSDILILFSFAEMGFGVAVTFSLYKPIAEKDIPKIQSLLQYFKRIYRIVILLITVIGACFFPFLGSLKTDIPLAQLQLYYVIFQFNNVFSYVWAYRESYVSACQQGRKLTLFTMVFSLATTLCQILLVLLTGNFLLYLLVNSGFVVLRKVCVNTYILRNFPETKFSDAPALPEQERRTILTKVKALAVHKVANLSISQTDSLIVSYMIDVTQWGYVSNYLMLKNTIAGVLNQIYSAILPSMGDLVARENREVQLHTFRIYDFINFWMYAFSFVALGVLGSPFVALCFGTARVLDEMTVFLFFLNLFIGGLRDPVSVLREARGAYERDKWYTVYSAIVNLVTSILFVKLLGLPGVFLGTLCSTMVVLIARPVLLFRHAYGCSSLPYFGRLLQYTAAAGLGYGITLLVRNEIAVLLGTTVLGFAVMTGMTAIVPNLVWAALFWRDADFREACAILKSRLRKGNTE